MFRLSFSGFNWAGLNTPTLPLNQLPIHRIGIGVLKITNLLHDWSLLNQSFSAHVTISNVGAKESKSSI